jgi:lipopolysaccharide/colanic/teichoic acid biosynthesis glycosyltransferase/glycosyltransferase involved in cell wall biosynthesis
MLPLFPWAISRLDLRGFDLILSVSHAAAKGIRKPPGCLHICYCLTPMRYIWEARHDYFKYADPLWIKRAAVRAMASPLRLWDRATAASVDYFIADSRHVQSRIAECYSREAELIYPPVDTEFFTPSLNGDGQTFYLIVSALVPYKRVDLAIDAFNRLGYPLVIAGVGPDLATLKRRAADNIQFKGFVSDADLRDLYRCSRAVVITAREDFGLVSLEAQACGRPPLAYASGGSLESILDGETGILFRSQTVAGLIEGVQRLENTRFNQQKLRRNAERFSRETFRRAILSSVTEKWRASRSVPSPAVVRSGAPPALPVWQLIDAVKRHHPSLSGIAGIAKRGADIALSLCGILTLSLPVLLIALLIRRDSPGPALFFQTRVGLRGRDFLMVKLRTMYVDAERRRGPTWAVTNDPRCTRLGRVMRRYGIDELPQLWNVLMGDMSLVGPRPERPEFQTVFEASLPEFRLRLRVRGGLSGLAQVRGWRGDTSIEKRLESDLDYIEHWSFWRDLWILCRTPVSLLWPKQLLNSLPSITQAIGSRRLHQGPTA